MRPGTPAGRIRPPACGPSAMTGTIMSISGAADIRRALPFAAVALIFAAATAGAASLASAAMPAVLDFAVKRGDSTIGRHVVTLRRDEAELHVDIEIDLAVSLGFVTLYRYLHQSREVWREGRLVSLESRTDDDGARHRVSARAAAGGLWVETAEGRFLAPADILPTSYWNPATVRQTRLLDSQHGRLVDVRIDPAGEQAVEIGGRPLPARRYVMNGDLRMSLWYGPAGEWVKIAFETRGATVEYVLEGAGPGHRDLLPLVADR